MLWCEECTGISDLVSTCNFEDILKERCHLIECLAFDRCVTRFVVGGHRQTADNAQHFTNLTAHQHEDSQDSERDGEADADDDCDDGDFRTDRFE